MFGYLKLHKPELKFKDYDYFKAVYCGICKNIKNRYGNIPRFTLNYESSFLAILLMEDKNQKNTKSTRCLLHPFKKFNIIKKNKAIEYAADVNILLAYFKNLDNILDEKNVKSKFYHCFLKKYYKKVVKKYPDKCKKLNNIISQINNLESKKLANIDLIASKFGNFMKNIFIPPWEINNKQKRILKETGFQIGRWIYFIDALDDLKNDLKNNQFNPLIEQFKLTKNKKLDKNLFSLMKESLTMNLDRLSACIELLDPFENKTILRNIIYISMNKKTNFIINKLFKNKRSCNEKILSNT